MAGLVQIARDTEGIRSGCDEKKCRWIPFPNGKAYLLPIATRHQKLVPVFGDDGSVLSRADTTFNADLALLVENFTKTLATADDNGVITGGINIYGDFMRLVRGLLLHNYHLTNDQIAEKLTVTMGGHPSQFERLFSAITLHITGD